MLRIGLWLQLLAVFSHCAVASPAGVSQKTLQPASGVTNQRKLNGRFLHITGEFVSVLLVSWR